jgi:cell division protein FtsW (lipid II flippase)
MKFHQLTRLTGWLRQDDPRVAQIEGYQLRQSVVVLGAGGAAGGNGDNLDYYLRMLPENHTDFIFSVVGGRWGLLGCAGVLGLYLVIVVTGGVIASATNEPFARLLVVGILAVTVTQVFINVGVTMGLVPITGMTLPLVSYGGTSLLVNAFALGLLVNIGRHRPVLLGKQPFEYD